MKGRSIRPTTWTAKLVFYLLSTFGVVALAPETLRSQDFPTDDPIIRRLWDLGMETSQVATQLQILTDYIGPRLHGSLELENAQDWLLEKYGDWGITARRERYGSWPRWESGTLHVDMVSPRRHTLEAGLTPWSAGTDGPVEGDVIALPEIAPIGSDSSDWLPLVKGKWVLLDPAVVSCRGPARLDPYARPETIERLDGLEQTRSEYFRYWADAFARDIPGVIRRSTSAFRGWGFVNRLGEAGALGILENWWFDLFGSFVIQTRGRISTPDIVLSCEDYGLLYRLAANGQHPRLRVDAEARWLGNVPSYNVIAEMRGEELPNEYVLLSAHLDSWTAATGATDNGTGTVTMLEAMRLLKEVYPHPRRTILVGHWAGEEPVQNGSLAFVVDHPDIVEGLQAVFNQDNGTWRIERIEGQGFLHAGEHIARWVSMVPRVISEHVALEFPGSQSHGGSDHVPFLCAGAPGFRLQSNYEDYENTGHHTNRDTYDKMIFEDLRENAILTAMLVYAASEDPVRMPRDRTILPIDPDTGQPEQWPRCPSPMRTPTPSLWWAPSG